MKEVKILMTLYGLSPSFDQSGSSRALILFNNLKKYFPNTYLIMQSSKNNLHIDNLIEICPIIPVQGNFRFVKSLLYIIKMMLFTIIYIYKNNINYFIFRGYYNVILYPFLKLMKVKIICDFHGFYHNELVDQNKKIKSKFVYICELFMLKYANKILPVSEGIMNQILEYKEKCLLLSNGIDIVTIKNAQNINIMIPNDKKIIGFIGNWEWDKRIEDLFESLNYLDNCVVVIVGLGYNAEYFINKYSGPNIIFTGRLQPNEAYGVLNKFDICVLPYDKKATISQFPGYYSTRKAKDYVAAGKPIIVSNVIAKEKWLVENENCLIYESRDPLDLSNKIKLLLNDKCLYDKLSNNNLKLANAFAWDTIILTSGLIEYINQL